MLFPNELRNTWRFIYISISIHHAHPFTSNILNCDDQLWIYIGRSVGQFVSHVLLFCNYQLTNHYLFQMNKCNHGEHKKLI